MARRESKGGGWHLLWQHRRAAWLQVHAVRGWPPRPVHRLGTRPHPARANQRLRHRIRGFCPDHLRHCRHRAARRHRWCKPRSHALFPWRSESSRMPRVGNSRQRRADASHPLEAIQGRSSAPGRLARSVRPRQRSRGVDRSGGPTARNNAPARIAARREHRPRARRSLENRSRPRKTFGAGQTARYCAHCAGS